MIKEGFILRKMPGMNLVMPTGNNVKEFNGALMLNDTGAYIFEKLQLNKNINDIANDLVNDYDVSLDIALKDIEKTIASLVEAGVYEK